MPFRRFLSSVLLAASLLGGVACSSGDAEPEARPRRGRPAGLQLTTVAADVVGPQRGREPLDTEVRNATMRVLQATFDATVVDAMRGTRTRPIAVRRLFTDDAAARATGPDRPALFDEDLPPIERLVAERRNVRLTGLAGDDGEPALVVAKIDWEVRSGNGGVRVRRAGELSLVPAEDRWVIGAYTVITTRTVAGATTTTTAAG